MDVMNEDVHFRRWKHRIFLSSHVRSTGAIVVLVDSTYRHVFSRDILRRRKEHSCGVVLSPVTIYFRL